MPGLQYRVRLTSCRFSGAFQWCSSPSSPVREAGCASAVKPLPASEHEPHTPVLLQQVLKAFSDVNLKVHADCTLGAGGHAEAIIRSHPELEYFIGIDQDASALEIAQQRLQQFEAKGIRLHYIHSNFSGLNEHIHKLIEQGNIPHGPDGVLLDLGVSSMQLDQAERGFSFMREGPLDMRMDASSSTTAEALVNDISEQELGKIIREYGEERMWRTVARRIVDARGIGRISNTTQLARIIGRTRITPGKGSSKRAPARGPHPATRTFQALRIAVNSELQVVEDVIPGAIEALRPQGRLAVISFHSLEDKIVKWAMRRAAGERGSGGGLDGEEERRRNAEMEILRARGMDAAEWEAAKGGHAPEKVVRLVGRRAVTAGDRKSVV